MCDFPDCSNESTSQITRLACFHTCHLVCLERNGNSCPICKDPFLKRITDLSTSFNKGLLEKNTDSTFPDINQSREQNASQPDISTTRNADFYNSQDWENMVSRSLEQLVIPQPSVPHTAAPAQESRHTASSTPHSRQNHCSHCGQPGHRRSHGSRITCPGLLQSRNQDKATFWELPAFLSQSTIGGRQGSNACTVISLLLAKTYIANKPLLQVNNSHPLSQSWLVAFVSCMLGGNQVYDTFISSHNLNPVYLGVVQAIPLVRSSLGNISYEEELTVCFVKEPCAAERSALSYQLSRRLISTNAAFTVISGLVNYDCLGECSPETDCLR